MREHAISEQPLECCGILGGRDGLVSSCYPLRNEAQSPQTRFFASPEDLFSAIWQIRNSGQQMLGIYHSHPQSPAFPSRTDIEMAFYPDVVSFIISLQLTPLMRAFRIREGTVEPVEYQIIEVAAQPSDGAVASSN